MKSYNRYNMKALTKRYKIIQIVTLVSVLLWLLCAIFLNEESSVFEFIMPTISIFTFLSILVCLLSRDIIKKKTCKKCKESLDNADYDYTLVSQEIKKNGDAYAKVQIEAECPHCGTIKTINKKFITYNEQKGTKYDLQTNVDKYCMQLFNH